MVKRRNFYHYDHGKTKYCRHDCLIDECNKCRDQGELVEKVICSKNIVTSAEFALPFAVELGGPGSFLYELLAAVIPDLDVTVRPNYRGVEQEVTALKDAVMIFGNIPATLSITTNYLPTSPLNIPIQIFFQEIAECKGVCPGDDVRASDPVIEKVLNQPLLGRGPNGTFVANLLLFKAVIRTHVTVVRSGIDRDGKFCDLDPHRCDPHRAPRTINTPYEITPLNSPLALSGNIGGGGGLVPPA